MQPKKVSIIIPCYNDHHFIEQALDSAINQTLKNKEIIIIDDGSNSLTKKLLKKMEPKIDFLISQENQGVSSARNRGIDKASGEFILNLDSDDFFEPQFSEKALHIFEQKKSTKIVTCHANWFDDQGGARIFIPEGGSLKQVLVGNVAMGSAMFKKEDWIKIGGYDEQMHIGYEDWEFYLRLLKSGGTAEVIPELLFHYRNKPDSRNKEANMEKFKILKYIYTKHSDIYKEHFEFFITEWMDNIQKSEAFKQQVMQGPEYRIGYQLLRPIRKLGFFKKKSI